MNLSENAKLVLEARYLRRDVEGRIIENPEELFRRVAKSVAQAEFMFGGQDKAEYWEDKLYKRLTSFEFLPNSPTLMNAGKTLKRRKLA